MIRKTTFILVSTFVLISALFLFVIIGANNKSFKINYKKSLAITTNKSLPFTDGNLCIVENNSLDCSRLFATSSVLKNILKSQQNTDDTSNEVNYSNQVFYVEIWTNADVYLRNLSLPPIPSSIASYALRTLINPYGYSSMQELDTLSPQSRNSIPFDQVIEKLLDKDQATNGYLLKANTPLVFKLQGIGGLEKLLVSFNVFVLSGTVNDLQISTRITPLFKQNIDESSYDAFIPRDDYFSIMTNHTIANVSTTIKNVEIDLLDPLTLKPNYFINELLNDDIEVSRESLVFIKSLWESLFRNGLANAVFPLDKQIDLFTLSGDFSILPKDFFNLTNIKYFQITNVINFQSSGVIENEWLAFFNNNTNLEKLEISNASLTNASFEPIRLALQDSNLSNLDLDLSNNDLKAIPHLNNSGIITSLNFEANLLDNVAILEVAYNNLQSLNLAFNGSLPQNVPNFLRSLDFLTSLDSLVLKGLSIGNNQNVLDDLQSSTNLVNLKNRLKEIDLSLNNLDSIASIFTNGNFKKLQKIYLNDNDLKDLPNDLWFSTQVGDKLVDLSNNPNLNIEINDANSGLAIIENLNIKNTGAKAFSNAYGNSTHLVSIILGGDVGDLVDYSFISNLPNSLNSLVITNAPEIQTFGSDLQNRLSTLNNLNSLRIVYSNIDDSFLDYVKDSSSIKDLDLSNNNLLFSREFVFNYPNLEKITIKNNNLDNGNGMKINSLLSSLFSSTNKLVEINVMNSKLLIDTNTFSQMNINVPQRVQVFISSPFKLEIKNNTNYEFSSFNALFHSNVQFLVSNSVSNTNLIIKIKTWILNTIKRNANELNLKESRKYSYLMNDQSITNSFFVHDGFKLPESSFEELMNDEVFPSYLSRVNLQKQNYEKNVQSFYSNLASIEDLQNEQNKVREDVSKLEKENKDLLNTIDSLKNGTLFQIAIALVALVLIINLSIVGVLIYRYKKKSN